LKTIAIILTTTSP